MNLQVLGADALVGACAAYAGWILLPGVARRAAARMLRKLPGAARLAPPVDAAAARGACSCNGCPSAGPAPPVPIRVIRKR